LPHRGIAGGALDSLHRRFADAGCDLVSTCTFGASSVRLKDGPRAGRMRELNVRAAEIAREGVGDGVLVAGAIGPTGQLAEPFGPLTRDMSHGDFQRAGTRPG